MVAFSLSPLVFMACGSELEDEPFPTAGAAGRSGSGGRGGSAGASANGSAGAGTNGSAGGGTNGAAGGGTNGAAGGGTNGSAGGANGAGGAGSGGAGGGASGAGGGGAGGAGGGPSTTIDFCNVQFPKASCSVIGKAGETIFGQVYIAGLTDVSAGPAPGVAADLLFATQPGASDPSVSLDGWTILSATPNLGNTNPSNDEYQATLPSQAADGKFAYVYRVSLNGGPFKYCDTNDGGDFDVSKAGAWTVAATCP